MADKKAAIGCARPTGSVVGANPMPADSTNTDGASAPQSTEREVAPVSNIMVGRKAPDFEAPAYIAGEFSSVKLSDYLGKWVVLCFYPGDYTFV